MTHGNTTHGMFGTKTYMAWAAAIQRCTNPKTKGFKNYGGRGIKVCERWAKFENFLEDMGVCSAGLSLERSDVNGDYSPDNCLWSDRKTQAINRRNVKTYHHAGKCLTLADWSRELGIPRTSLYRWVVDQGKPLESCIPV